jgi:hypothetical protein
MWRPLHRGTSPTVLQYNSSNSLRGGLYTEEPVLQRSSLVQATCHEEASTQRNKSYNEAVQFKHLVTWRPLHRGTSLTMKQFSSSNSLRGSLYTEEPVLQWSSPVQATCHVEASTQGKKSYNEAVQFKHLVTWTPLHWGTSPTVMQYSSSTSLRGGLYTEEPGLKWSSAVQTARWVEAST